MAEQFEKSIHSGNESLILYRLDKLEDSVGKAITTQAELVAALAVMNNEVTHVAKDAGKSSGTIAGIGTGIVMSIIGIALQFLLGVK